MKRSERSILLLLCFGCWNQNAHAQTEPDRDTTFLDFVGTGNVQRSLDNGEGLPASTGLGVMLDEYHIDKSIFWGTVYRVRFSGQINVANTEDTLAIEYKPDGALKEPSAIGEAIMTPLVGRRAADLDLMLFFDSATVGSFLSGMHVKYTGSNRLLSDTATTVKATMNAIRLRLFHDIVGRKYNKDFNVLIGAGWAYNSIRGDVGLAANESFRGRLLGTKRKAFNGLEIFAQFRIKNIKAEFSYTWLDPGGNIPGISGGRMITTVSFVGGFPVKLN